MKTIEKILISLILGFIPPVFFSLIYWWFSFLFFEGELYIAYSALLGFLLGILIDIKYLKSSIKNFYKLNTATLILIYIFYSIGIFGFFMGVPIFNIIPGIIAGVYFGRKYYLERAHKLVFDKKINRLNIFNIFMLLPIFLFSSLLALTDDSTPANLEGMLRLTFNITTNHILGIIFIGGISLLISQYFIVKYLSHISFRNFK